MKNSLINTRLNTVFENNGLFWSKDDEEPKKAPKGFEKFLKKTREGKKSVKDTNSDEKKKDDKKAQKKEDDDDDLSEEEVEDKGNKKEKEDS